MSDQTKIPVLTDLVAKGDEIKMADLGLEDERPNQANDRADDSNQVELSESDSPAVDPFLKAALEQSIRRILDEHMELAWQEIKLVIQREFDKKR